MLGMVVAVHAVHVGLRWSTSGLLTSKKVTRKHLIAKRNRDRMGLRVDGGVINQEGQRQSLRPNSMYKDASIPR